MQAEPAAGGQENVALSRGGMVRKRKRENARNQRTKCEEEPEHTGCYAQWRCVAESANRRIAVNKAHRHAGKRQWRGEG